MRPLSLAVFVAVFVAGLPGCKDTGKFSADQARQHVLFLAETVSKDVEEVRSGLPAGAEVIATWWKSSPLEADPRAAQDSLEAAKRKVSVLRMAKSTFFAVATPQGIVLRNDQEQDRMSGKALFPAFPGLKDAVSRYVEARGSLPEAAGVRAPRADGQWVAGVPVRVSGETKGLYVTGWAWTSYAYRLEFAVRGKIRTELMEKHQKKEPLVYVYVLVDKAAFGAPVSPEVNATAITKLEPLSKVHEGEPFVSQVEIDGRTFGLAVQRAPALGADVAVAVLRSET